MKPLFLHSLPLLFITTSTLATDLSDPIVVESDEKKNESKINVPFESTEIDSKKFDDAISKILKDTEYEDSEPEHTLTQDHYKFKLDDDIHFVYGLYDERQSYLLKRIQDHMVIYYYESKHDNMSYEEAEEFLSKDNSIIGPLIESYRTQWHKTFSWDDQIKPWLKTHLYPALRQSIQHLTSPGLYRSALVSSQRDASISQRPDKFTILSAAQYRLRVSRAISQLQHARKALLKNIDELDFPLGEETSPRDAFERGQEIQYKINRWKRIRKRHAKASPKTLHDSVPAIANLMVAMVASLAVSGQNDDPPPHQHLRPDPPGLQKDPELARKAKKKIKEWEAKQDEYRQYKLLTQLIGIEIRRRALDQIQAIESWLSWLKNEKNDVTASLEETFNQIRERSLGTENHYRERYHQRIDKLEGDLDATSVFEPGRVTRFNSQELLHAVNELVENFEEIDELAELTDEMTLKRLISLSLQFGIEERGKAIRNPQRVPGTEATDFSNALTQDALTIFDRFFLISDGQQSIPSIAYDEHESHKIRQLWQEMGEYGKLAQTYLSIVLIGHGFWHDEIVVQLESLSDEFFDEQAIDQLIVAAFESLPYYDQLRVLDILEARNSRNATAAADMFYERVRIQREALKRTPLNEVDLRKERRFKRDIKQRSNSKQGDEFENELESIIERSGSFNELVWLVESQSQNSRVSIHHWRRITQQIERYFEERWQRLYWLAEYDVLGDEELLNRFENDPEFQSVLMRMYDSSDTALEREIVKESYQEEAASLQAQSALMSLRLKDLARQAVVLKRDVAKRAQLLSEIAQTQLVVNGSRSRALYILTRLGGQIETEPGLFEVHQAYLPAFQQVRNTGIDRRLILLELSHGLEEFTKRDRQRELESDIASSETSLAQLEELVRVASENEPREHRRWTEEIERIQQQMKLEVLNASRRQR